MRGVPTFSPTDPARRARPPLDPHTFLDELRRVGLNVARLQRGDNYQTLHALAFEALRARSVATQTRSSEQDPTGDLALSDLAAGRRRALEDAMRSVQAAGRELRSAERRLTLALGGRPRGRVPRWW